MTLSYKSYDLSIKILEFLRTQESGQHRRLKHQIRVLRTQMMMSYKFKTYKSIFEFRPHLVLLIKGLKFS
jgi:hypothetical protein